MWWHTGREVKGKLANGVGSQYPSHYLGTWCIQHYYRWWRTPRLPVVDWTDAPADLNRLFLSPKGEIWFLRVCHHISTGLYLSIRDRSAANLKAAYCPTGRMPWLRNCSCSFMFRWSRFRISLQRLVIQSGFSWFTERSLADYGKVTCNGSWPSPHFVTKIFINLNSRWRKTSADEGCTEAREHAIRNP
jgi:hypothetical protein